MKRIITLFAFLICFGVNAQKKVARQVEQLITANTTFTPVSVLTAAPYLEYQDNNKIVENATYAKLDNTALETVTTNKFEHIELAIPYQGNTLLVQLYKVNPLAEGFHVDTNKQLSITYNSGVYYRGIVKGDQNSVASISFFDNEVSGIVSGDEIDNLVIGKTDRKNPDSDYIIYSDSKLKIQNNFQCHTKDNFVNEIAEPVTSKSTVSNKCVTIYFEVDHDLFLANGANAMNSANWVTSLFNNVQTLYANDGISVALKSIYVWTTQDPYSGDDSSDYLFQFHDNTCVFDADLGQLLGMDGGGNGGVAVGINGLCTQSNFSYSDVPFQFSNVPVFSWAVEVVTHELGHLMGSPHTHGCYWNGNNTAIDGCGSSVGYTEGTCPQGPIPSTTVKGTIMSYCHLVNAGIKFSNGFGPQPAALILNSVNNAGCLGTNCTNTCVNSICSVDVANVTSNSASVSWNETDDVINSWQVSVRPFSATTGSWVTVNTNSNYNASGLLPNTYYRARVSKNCGTDFTAPTSEAVFLTSANYCNGIVMTDTGGVNGNYGDDQLFVRTIIPNIANRKIKLTFTEFSLEEDYDYLYLYDGNSANAPDLSNGGFTGSENPGTFTSTAADGSLTLKFYSDGGVVDQGYVASISCENRLATNDFEADIDFTYYPNPANGFVSIDSKTKITEVAVYNIAGQLLYKNDTNALHTKVDISAYANGTYFFKLKFENKETHFKIQKN